MSALWPFVGCSATFAAATAILTTAIFHPRSQQLGQTHWRGSPAARTDPHRPIALTFDDGPHPHATPQILHILKQHHIHATFFIIGRHAHATPHLLTQIHDQGHLVANHSFDHHHTGCLKSTTYWQDQLTRTNDIIHTHTRSTPSLFRPPMGFRSPLTMLAAQRLNMQTVTWTRSARDGSRPHTPRIIRRLTRHISPGDILTLHDGIDPWLNRPWQPVVEALPKIIASLKQQGFTFARLDHLLAP